MEQEVEHIIEVLEATKQALIDNDSAKLHELSDHTIHHASIDQDAPSLSIAVLVYTLGKLIERKEGMKIKNWNKFVKKVTSYLSLAVTALLEKRNEKYEEYINQARNSVSTISISLKPYIQEVLRKASINKASKIYEHGVSLGQTAKILGLSQWELLEYTGQTKVGDLAYNKNLDAKKRAQMALEFFS